MRWLLRDDGVAPVIQSWEYQGVEHDPTDEVEAALNRIVKLYPDLQLW